MALTLSKNTFENEINKETSNATIILEVFEKTEVQSSDGSTVSYPSSCFLISDDLDLEDFVIVFKCFCTIVFKHDRTTWFFMRCVKYVVFDALRV